MSEHRGVEGPDSNQATAAVLERAQRVITERRLAEALRLASSQRPWQSVCIVLPLALIAGTVFWPSGTLTDRLRVVVRGICDQQHNLTLSGKTLPLDARCTGIYTGFLLALGCLLAQRRLDTSTLPRRPILVAVALAILVLGIDGINSWLVEIGRAGLYAPHNALRLASGMGGGLVLALVGLPVFIGTIRAPTSVERGSGSTTLETLGMVGLSVLVGALLWGGPGWLFEPLAFFSVLGAFAALSLMNLFVVAVIGGLQRGVVLVRQLARPAVLSMILTAVELGGLAWLRGALGLVRVIE